MKISNDELVELSEIYKSSGKNSMLKVLHDKYQIKNTSSVIKRMKNKNLIETAQSNPETAESIFMSMDELCSATRLKLASNKSIETDNKSKAMHNLIHELIGDRLLELSRYITMDVSGRVVFIDKTAFVADGYQVILH